MSEFNVKILGVRGSYPTPEIDKLKYGGHTSCIAIEVNGLSLIFDAGTGIISYGEDLYRQQLISGVNSEERENICANIFVTHSHFDHLMGLHYFKPAFLKTSTINLFGCANLKMSFEDTIKKSMFNPYFPLDFDEISANTNIFELETDKLIIYRNGSQTPEFMDYDTYYNNEEKDDVIVSYFKSHAHPKEGVLVFKVSFKGKSVVFATDKESYFNGDIKLITFAKNADLLIHDAQYSDEEYTSPALDKQGFGHSTPKIAADTAKKANVQKLLLYHFDPKYTDVDVKKLEEDAKELFLNTQAAYEGMTIKIL